jgi:hypothetical protein
MVVRTTPHFWDPIKYFGETLLDARKKCREMKNI